VLLSSWPPGNIVPWKLFSDGLLDSASNQKSSQWKGGSDYALADKHHKVVSALLTAFQDKDMHMFVDFHNLHHLLPIRTATIKTKPKQDITSVREDVGSSNL
jgi:hypothetical protein